MIDDGLKANHAKYIKQADIVKKRGLNDGKLAELKHAFYEINNVGSLKEELEGKFKYLEDIEEIVGHDQMTALQQEVSANSNIPEFSASLEKILKKIKEVVQEWDDRGKQILCLKNIFFDTNQAQSASNQSDRLNSEFASYDSWLRETMPNTAREMSSNSSRGGNKGLRALLAARRSLYNGDCIEGKTCD